MALRSLECVGAFILEEEVATLPPSLQELRLNRCYLAADGDFRHLPALRVLHRVLFCSDYGEECSFKLPPSVEELKLVCRRFTPQDAPFAALPRLRTLEIKGASLPPTALASLPPSLARLCLTECNGFAGPLRPYHNLQASDGPCTDVDKLDADAVFPHLPALEHLNVSWTGIGNAAIASLPPSLRTLDVTGCANVTPAARLDHLPHLTLLHCACAAFAPAALAACRARGCAVPALAALQGGSTGDGLRYKARHGSVGQSGGSSTRRHAGQRVKYR